MKIDLLQTDLYAITGEEYSAGRSTVEVVGQLILAGCRIIQYREKDKKSGRKFAECLEIRRMTREAGVTFIVNDDVDIAMLVDADGVHVGQDDLPIEQVRRLVGPEKIIGLSTHSPEQCRDAIARGADYIGVGPIFRTFTKKDVCDPVGLDYLEYVRKNHPNMPHVAIGGIKDHNLPEVLARNAACVCLVTDIIGAENIPAKVAQLCAIISAERAKASSC